MKSILVVEDSRAAFEILRRTLLASGKYSADYFCRNGDNLMAMYEQHRPDLVVMDIVLEGTDGIDLTRDLMKIHPEARVVMITSLSYQEVYDSAMAAGALGFITKPYRPEQVISAFDRALASP